MRTAAFHPDFGQSVFYELEDLPEDGDGQVVATIDRMRELSRADQSNPYVQMLAQRAIEAGQGNPLAGVWALVKRGPGMRFQHDDVTARRIQTSDPRIKDVIEVLIRPADQARLILEGRGFEDCDGFELTASCLLSVLGIRWAFVTAAVNPEAPDNYSHVYLAAYSPCGKRIALDFSHGEYPGWECPNLGRVREWPMDESGYGFAGVLSTMGAIAALVGAYFAISKGFKFA